MTDVGDDPADPNEPGHSGAASAQSDDAFADDDPVADESTQATPSSAMTGSQQLHPLTIPYQLVRQGAAFVFFLFFAGVPGLTALFGSRGGLIAIGAVGLSIAAVVGYAFAWYRRYEYELTPDTFDIRSGVFARREREIPLRRIQNVDISQSVVQRVLSIAVINLETAGGGETEAQLQFVGEDEADRIQTEVSRLRRGATESGESAEPEVGDTIFEITERELGVLAVVSTDFRVVSLLFFGASLFGPQAYSFMSESFFASPESVLGSLLGPIAGIVTVIVLGLVSGLVNAARYYGFRLTRTDEELRYERGMFQKYSGTIPLSKVQTLTIRENVIARKLGYAALYIETAGHVASAGEAGGSQSAIPLAERDRVDQLARSIEPATLGEFQRPPKRARERYAARYAIVLLTFAAAGYLVTLPFDLAPYWAIPLAGLVLVPVAAHLTWKHRGFAVGEDHVVTRNGFWSRRTKVVPYHRVQTTVSTETIFQRRRRLGTVVVDTAGAQSFGGDDAKAVDVDVSTANDVRETVVDRLYQALRKQASIRTQSPTTDADLGDTGSGPGPGPGSGAGPGGPADD